MYYSMHGWITDTSASARNQRLGFFLPLIFVTFLLTTNKREARGKDIYKKRVLPFASRFALNYVFSCGSLLARSTCRAEATRG